MKKENNQQRALHTHFSDCLLPRQFFKQSILLWPALRIKGLNLTTLLEIWKIAPVVDPEFPYLNPEGISIDFGGEENWEWVQVMMPEAQLEEESRELFLVKNSETSTYYYFILKKNFELWRVQEDLSQEFYKQLVPEDQQRHPQGVLFQIMKELLDT